jgi:DNA-directed RNA polymerase
MSKDEVAGRMVGLMEQEKPIDFYIVVAKGILNRNVGTDLGGILAKIPMKLIRKGISKRGTMTKAYDAGVKCIADIIYMDCYDAGMTTKYGITKTIAKKLSKDLVETYNTICSGPVSIKNYLQALVKHRVSEQNEDTVCWMSPSGFPCVSEKWIMNKKKIELPFTSGRIQVVVHEQTTRPAMHEMISGISPNYVHSMDAAHMSLVIVELEKAGILSFGAIHDSFSVHAEKVAELLHITKETFINIYVRNIFADMRTEIIGNDPLFLESEPTKGKLDLLELMKSDYFFC